MENGMLMTLPMRQMDARWDGKMDRCTAERHDGQTHSNQQDGWTHSGTTGWIDAQLNDRIDGRTAERQDK